MKDKIFTENELREMEKRTLDRLLEAIDQDDSEAAKKIANRMYNEFLSMHDLYRNWITATLTEIGEKFGDEVLDMSWWRACVRGGSQ